MRILFILENYYPNIGGVETLFQNLAESLAQKGHKITVLTNKFSKSLKSKEELNGVSINRLPFYNRYLFTVFAIPHSIKYGIKADIIHTTSYNAGIPAFFGGLFSRTKTIITFHEVWAKLWFDLPFFGYLSKLLHYSFEKFLLKLPFYKFIAVSNYTSQSLSKNGIPSDKIEMIYNGISYDQWQSSSDNNNETQKFTFLYFGRLGISKGLNILLEAIYLLSKKRKDFKINLVIPETPINLYKEVHRIIESFEIKAYIDIMSDLKIEELQNIIRSSDCTIIPSYSEGFCYTAVESMALNTAIISSGKGALKEVVSGKHLTMQKHDAEDLATRMNEAMNGEWDYSELKTFPINKSVQAYENLYQTIINH